MGRFWSILFLLVPILGVGIFVIAMMGDSGPLPFHWLPVNISEEGLIIDNLFNFILWLTGIIFVITSLILFYVLWRYDAEKNTDPIYFMHGSHTLEVVWSIIPAATLLFIAIYQMDAWADAKLRRPTNPGPDQVVGTPDDPLLPDGSPAPMPPTAEVTGRQFEWRIRYPGVDGIIGTQDDLFTVNDLHVPSDEPVVLAIKSQDVLHSFFLPNLRVKQDVVPGMSQFVWFVATRDGTYDIVCAELCGWGHYKMKGRLTVEPRKQFDEYLSKLSAEQNVTTFTPTEDEDE